MLSADPPIESQTASLPCIRSCYITKASQNALTFSFLLRPEIFLRMLDHLEREIIVTLSAMFIPRLSPKNHPTTWSCYMTEASPFSLSFDQNFPLRTFSSYKCWIIWREIILTLSAVPTHTTIESQTASHSHGVATWQKHLRMLSTFGFYLTRI